MIRHNTHKLIISFLILAFCISKACATDNSINDKISDMSVQKVEYGKVHYDVKTFKKNMEATSNKFVNLNIQAAYDDMLKMIVDNESNDYCLMLLADKAVGLGFFDLADIAFSKISDYEIANLDSENTHKLFFPKNRLSRQDVIVLAEAYSNIQFNDRCNEAITEINSKIDNIDNDDYANYLLSLAYLKLNDIDNANKYIQKAMNLNTENLNYKILHSQIVANSKRNKKALKLAKDAYSKDIAYYPIQKQIEANEEYIKYKTEKQAWLQDYHLGYYYYLKDDNSKALRVLQSAISKNNSRNALLYALMSRIYIKNGDYERANTVATKAYNYNLSNINTLLSLGDIAYENNKYKQALKYYKQAAKSRSSVTEAKLKLADTYSKLNNIKSSKSIYQKVAKSDGTAYQAFYQIALTNPATELTYLKKSVAINPNFKDGWIDLSRVMIEKGNLALAKKYLENAYYIDDNDFRYYYYQSLLIKKTEEINRLEKE